MVKDKGMKKKLVCMGIVVMMCLGVAGCANSNNKNTIEDNNSTTEVEELSEEEFSKQASEIAITSENWKDYFDLSEELVIGKDDLGNPTGEETTAWKVICKKNVRANEDLIMNFKYSYLGSNSEYLTSNNELVKESPKEEKEEQKTIAYGDLGNTAIINTEYKSQNLEGFKIPSYVIEYKELQSIELENATGTVMAIEQKAD